MQDETPFPPPALVAAAQLAPHRVRLQAFLIDASVLIVVLVLGGLASVLGRYALDFGVSGMTIGLFALAVFVGFGVMNAMLAYLTNGQTVGKAFCGLVERRRANTPGIGEPAGLTRLMGRHTIGYLVIDMFGLGVLAAFRLTRRRCLHDVAFDTEVLHIGGPENRLLRVKQLDQRRRAVLADMREQWGWLYHLLKWASGLVIAVVGFVVTAFKALGLLSSHASPAASPAVVILPAATAPSAIATAVLVGGTAAMTLVVPVTLASWSDSGYACAVLDQVDLQTVASEARLQSPKNRAANDSRYEAGFSSTCSESSFVLNVDQLSTNGWIYENSLATLDVDGGYGALGLWFESPVVEAIEQDAVDRGVVAVYAAQDYGFGREQPVTILFESGQNLVRFVGPLEEPADWEAVMADLAAAVN